MSRLHILFEKYYKGFFDEKITEKASRRLLTFARTGT